MTKKEELIKAYQEHMTREFGDDEEYGVISNNQLDLFYTDNGLNGDNYHDMQVSITFDDNGVEYLMLIDGECCYTEKCSFEQAIEELKWCGFDDYYGYFAERSNWFRDAE